jgi:glutamine amidotransferase
MQMMAQRSFEGGEHRGLGWLEGDVVRLTPEDSQYRVPHVGWSEVVFTEPSCLFQRVSSGTDFYFVHSFHLRLKDATVGKATANHGGEFTAVLQRGNIFGTQFHPEKSQRHGLTVLANFLSWQGDYNGE